MSDETKDVVGADDDPSVLQMVLKSEEQRIKDELARVNQKLEQIAKTEPEHPIGQPPPAPDTPIDRPLDHLGVIDQPDSS